MSAVRCDLLPADEAGEIWDELAGRLGSSPFLRPGWILPWHKAFSRGRLSVLVAFRDEHPVGVLPLVERFGFGFSPTNWHTPEFGVIAEDTETARELVRHAAVRSRWQLQLSFVDQETSDLITGAATEAGRPSMARVMSTNLFLPLTGSFEDYRSSLSRNTRQQLSRRRRQLEGLGDTRFEVHHHWDRGLFDDFLRVERSGWKSAAGSAIIDNPHLVEFYEEVAAWAARRGWLRMEFLRVGETVAAGDLSLEVGGAHYLLKTGYEPELEQFTPGRLLREDSIRNTFVAGLATYEFLGGDARWKRSFRPQVRDQWRVHAFAPGLGGRSLRLVQDRGRDLARRARHRRRRSPTEVSTD